MTLRADQTAKTGSGASFWLVIDRFVDRGFGGSEDSQVQFVACNHR